LASCKQLRALKLKKVIMQAQPTKANFPIKLDYIFPSLNFPVAFPPGKSLTYEGALLFNKVGILIIISCVKD
jgi:hypothetical protein